MRRICISNVLALVILAAFFVVGQGHVHLEPSRTSRYPNEISGYKFYQKAKWKSLTPLVSTMADVRRVLGDPIAAHDISRYTEPYPGDSVAKSPVFTYSYNSDWKILVYFVKSSGCDCPNLRKSFGDRLFSIELLPEKRVPFGRVIFPSTFKKKNVVGVDAAWDEYADGIGLSYHVYTTKTPYGSEQPGDLNRIVYAPSDEELTRSESK